MTKTTVDMIHIALFVMTPFKKEAALQKYSFTNGVTAECKQTNETALRYFQWYLQKQEKIEFLEAAFAFITETAAKTFNDFSEHMQNEFTIDVSGVKQQEGDLGSIKLPALKLIPVELPAEGSLEGAFAGAGAMIEKIKKYLFENYGKEDMTTTTIHIDMTGGPRHDVMLMMSLVQILKSYGVKVGKVVYTNFFNAKNFVEEATSVMDMYTLTAGVEEFRNYASAKILYQYFSEFDWHRGASDSLKDLISHMQEFSENLKLCIKFEEVEAQLVILESSLNNYRKHIEDKRSLQDSNEEIFFAKLFPTIVKAYAKVLGEKPLLNSQKHKKFKSLGELQILKNIKKIVIIEWCVIHGLIQQAVTFFNEWIGSIVISVVEISPDLKRRIDNIEHGNSDWETFLIRKYSPSYSNPEYAIQEEDTIETKKVKREKCFNKLFEDKLIYLNISSKGKAYLTKENFIRVVQLYEEVNDHRNRMNHAGYSVEGSASDSVGDLILKTLSILEETYNTVYRDKQI